MRTPWLRAPIDGLVVHPVQSDDDARAAMGWLMEGHDLVAVDTETTGLDFHADVRLVQFGDTRTAWVMDPHKFRAPVEMLAFSEVPLVAHNAPFDILHLARLLDAPFLPTVTDLMARTTDTLILAHLVDPREKKDGGIGHGLKALAEEYVDPDAPDSDHELRALFKSFGLTVARGFAEIDVGHPTFVMYSGMDVGLTARLHEVLAKMVADLGLDHLAEFEHRAQTITTAMTARGFRVDQVYGHELSEVLAAEQTNAEHRAALLGVDNVNSVAQVAAALEARGAVLTETTASGAPKVDKHVLQALDDDLAREVLTAKQSGKFLAAYVDPIIEAALVDGRVHPRIRSLAAKTGRQSISNPPLHQLPSGDHRIRTCLIPDDGQQLVAADFSQVEFRVLAALSGGRSPESTGGPVRSSTE
jgi:DNA polymerase-1